MEYIKKHPIRTMNLIKAIGGGLSVYLLQRFNLNIEQEIILLGTVIASLQVAMGVRNSYKGGQ